MDEFARIHQILKPLTTGTSEALGLQDDAAWLTPPAGHTLIAAADALVAGVHFLGTEDPALIARKALRVNLSDLAAMGSMPYGYLLTTQLPKDLPESWLSRFAEGLAEDQVAFGFRLFGGDSTSTPGPIALSVTALGLLAEGQKPLRRNNAQPGDLIAVSGVLGAGALGLKQMRHGISDGLSERYLLPEPRIMLGQALHDIATACMDVSDGLMQDAAHIARASRMSLEIDASTLPLPESDAFTWSEKQLAALTGGDDYELLFTLPQGKLETLRSKTKTLFTVIGRVQSGEGVSLQHAPPDFNLAQTGWRHFE